MKYIFETHLHTSEASRCGRVSGSDYIDFMISRGYNGIVVTDHFFNGNSCVPQFLPWDIRVDRYCEGYKRAKKAAEGKDFTVLFGIEFNFAGDEYLIHGVDDIWLKDNKDIMRMTRSELHKAVAQAGGVMFQAHPYRERGYLVDIKLKPDCADGIEIYNAANDDNMNALAYQYAIKHGLPFIAGSDIHFFHDGPMGGMRFDERPRSEEEFVIALKERRGEPVRLLDGKVERIHDIEELLVPTHEPQLPVINL